jgi:hypothetical protein
MLEEGLSPSMLDPDSDQELAEQAAKVTTDVVIDQDPLALIPTVPGTGRKIAMLSDKSLDVLVKEDFDHASLASVRKS